MFYLQVLLINYSTLHMDKTYVNSTINPSDGKEIFDFFKNYFKRLSL